MARKIAFSIFYVLYIVQFTRIGIVLRKALQIMQVDSKFLQILVSRVIFACCLSLFLQIISMLSRVIWATESYIVYHNTTACTVQHEHTVIYSNEIIYVETSDPNKYPKGRFLAIARRQWQHRLQFLRAIQGRLTSVHLSFLWRQSGFQQCTF